MLNASALWEREACWLVGPHPPPHPVLPPASSWGRRWARRERAAGLHARGGGGSCVGAPASAVSAKVWGPLPWRRCEGADRTVGTSWNCEKC